MAEAKYQVANRRLMKDPWVVAEFDRLEAHLRGALAGVRLRDVEAALEVGLDNFSGSIRPPEASFDEAGVFTFPSGQVPQGAWSLSSLGIDGVATALNPPSLEFSAPITAPFGFEVRDPVVGRAPDGDVTAPPWVVFYSGVPGPWGDIVFGSPTLVAIRSGGATFHVMTSSLGKTWTGRTHSNNNGGTGIAHGGGTFVSVSPSVPATSADGINWTNQTNPANTSTERVAFSADLSLFCAVGAFIGAGTSQVMTSPDGVTWTARTAATTSDWEDVTFGNDLFVAVASTGANRVMTSPDGITWTARTAAAARFWTSVIYASELGLFVAVAGAAGGSNGVMTSPDGITWTQRTAPTGSWNGVAWNGEVLVATGFNASMVSTDGIAWTTQTTPTGQWWRVVWSSVANAFIAISRNTDVGATAGRVLVSTGNFAI